MDFGQGKLIHRISNKVACKTHCVALTDAQHEIFIVNTSLPRSKVVTIWLHTTLKKEN